MSKKKLRKVWVLREVEIKFEDLKKGDVFRLGKANPKDCVNEQQWSRAVDDPFYPPRSDKKHGIETKEIAFVECVMPEFSR